MCCHKHVCLACVQLLKIQLSQTGVCVCVCVCVCVWREVLLVVEVPPSWDSPPSCLEHICTHTNIFDPCCPETLERQHVIMSLFVCVCVCVCALRTSHQHTHTHTQTGIEFVKLQG